MKETMSSFPPPDTTVASDPAPEDEGVVVDGLKEVLLVCLWFAAALMASFKPSECLLLWPCAALLDEEPVLLCACWLPGPLVDDDLR